MGKLSRKDYISNLPESITATILTKVPIRDAVRTSTLSRKWRYQWATMNQLVLDDDDRKVTRKELVNIIIRYFLLHDGPIHRFELYTSYAISSTDMDTWLLFLSRKNVKELVLGVRVCSGLIFFRTPSYICACQKLTELRLFGFKVEPSSEFQGFPCLKYLNLGFCPVTSEVLEKFISGCPLLEKFELIEYVNHDNLALTVRSPNLKHLTVKGKFIVIYLQHTPLLVNLMLSFSPEDWEDNVLVKVPVTYDCLEFISLGRLNFDLMNQRSYVLHLLLQSPNLQELRIESTAIMDDRAADLDFWEKECSTDSTFKNFKKVMVSGVSNENCMEFLKFVLGHSPLLEVMSVSPCEDHKGKMKMANEVLHFHRASSIVDIRFFE